MFAFMACVTAVPHRGPNNSPSLRLTSSADPADPTTRPPSGADACCTASSRAANSLEMAAWSTQHEHGTQYMKRGSAQVGYGGVSVHVVGDHERATAILRADHRVRRVAELRGHAHLLKVLAVAAHVQRERIPPLRLGVDFRAAHIQLAHIRVHEENL